MKLPNGYGTVIKMRGKRRKPYMVRRTVGWKYDPEKDRQVQQFNIIGYAATRQEGLQMLAEYNKAPYDTKAAKMTFADVFEKWSEQKYRSISKSNINGYNAAYGACSYLYHREFRDLKLVDLQSVIDNCGKNYPTMKKIKSLFSQMYDYAMKNEICNKDYSGFVDILQYKDRNPNKRDRDKFTREEVGRVWTMQEDPYYQIILMLLYSGVRIGELLDLKKENVHLDEQYFDVLASKTENGIRKVPIADKVLPFYKSWMEKAPECEYLLHSPEGKHFLYRNYYDSYYWPLMKDLSIDRTPHCTRHTTISMLAEAGVNQTIIKRIVGHSGAMNLTEKVYMHFDMQELIDAINQI